MQIMKSMRPGSIRKRPKAPTLSATLHPSVGAVVEELECRQLMTRLVGIDVSSYQGTITWSTVKNSKDFAFIRATTGQNTVDSKFTANANGAINNGMYAGFYHYAYYSLSGHTAVSEADHFFDVVKNYLKADGKHLMPVLDVEDGTTVAVGGTLDAWCDAWCQRVQTRALNELGLVVTPMIYTSASHAASYFSTGVMPQNYPLWVAQWPSSLPNTQRAQPSGVGDWQSSTSPFSYSSWSFWQYADNGSVSGISGNVDLDVFQGDDNAIKTYVIGSTAGRWAAGTRVQANSSSPLLKAWSTPSASGTYSTVPNGTKGTIVYNSTYGTTHDYGSSFWRWYVQFDNGMSGWVAEYQSVQPTSPYAAIDWLTTVTPSAPSSPTPASSDTTYLTSLPANFTWAAANASSYDVYLDGVKKATTTSASWSHPAIADGTHTWRVDAVNGEITTTGPTWTFVLGLPPAYVVGSTLHVNYPAPGTVSINGSGSNIVVSQAGTNYTFPKASISAITVTTTDNNDTLSLFGSIPAPISLNGGGTNSVTVNPFADVTLDTDAPGYSILVGSGAALSINVPVHLASLTITGGAVYLPAGGTTPLAVGNLSVDATGSLDLADNALVWNYTGASPIDSLRTFLYKGRNYGTWDGAGGIRSSAAAADDSYTSALGYLEASDLGVATFAGVAADATTLVVRYTSAGDVNLDGKVDADDYALTDRGFARNVANPHWLDGDFDYDGILGAGDYLLLDSSSLAGSSPSPALLAAREATFGPAYASALLATESATESADEEPSPAPAAVTFSDAPIIESDAVPATTTQMATAKRKTAPIKFAARGPVTASPDHAIHGRGSQVDGPWWVNDDSIGLTSDPEILG